MTKKDGTCLIGALLAIQEGEKKSRKVDLVGDKQGQEVARHDLVIS